MWGDYSLSLAFMVTGFFMEALRAGAGAVLRSKEIFGDSFLFAPLVVYSLICAFTAVYLLWLRPSSRTLALVCTGLALSFHVVLALLVFSLGAVVELLVYTAAASFVFWYLKSRDMAALLKMPLGHQTRNLRLLHVGVTAFGLMSLAGVLLFMLEAVIRYRDWLPLGSA